MEHALPNKPSWILMSGSVLNQNAGRSRDQKMKASPSQKYSNGFRGISSQWRGIRSASSDGRRSQLLPSRPTVERTLSCENLRKTPTPTVETVTEVFVHRDGSMSSKITPKVNGVKDIEPEMVDAFIASTKPPIGSSGTSLRALPARISHNALSSARMRSARGKSLGSMRSYSNEVLYPSNINYDDRVQDDLTDESRSATPSQDYRKPVSSVIQKSHQPATLPHRYFGSTRINLYHPLYNDVSKVAPSNASQSLPPSPPKTVTTRGRRSIRSADAYSHPRTHVQSGPPTFTPRSAFYRDRRNIYGVLNFNPGGDRVKVSQDTARRFGLAEGCSHLNTQVRSYEVAPEDDDVQTQISDSARESEYNLALSEREYSEHKGSDIPTDTTQGRFSRDDDQPDLSCFEVVDATTGNTNSSLSHRADPTARPSRLKFSDFYHMSVGDGTGLAPRPAKPQSIASRPSTKEGKRSVRFSTENQIHEFDVREPVKTDTIT